MAPNATQYKITSLDDWAAVVDGDADGDGAGGRLLEIKGGAELQSLPNPSREAMLGAVAHFGGSLVATIESEGHEIDGELLLSIGAVGAGTASSILDAASSRPLDRPIKPEYAAHLSRASSRIMSLMLLDAAAAEPVFQEIDERAQIAIDVLQILSGSGGRRQLDALIEALSPERPGDSDVREVEARARLRMKAIYRKVSDESLTVAQIRDDFELSRQRLQQLRKENRLFAIDIPYEKGLVYPAWQFEASGRPRAAMATLIDAAREAGLDALGFHLLMSGRRNDGRRGVELVQAGEETAALRLIRSADR
jgi:hypothetical protein